jgi:hypothetical protein
MLCFIRSDKVLGDICVFGGSHPNCLFQKSISSVENITPDSLFVKQLKVDYFNKITGEIGNGSVFVPVSENVQIVPYVKEFTGLYPVLTVPQRYVMVRKTRSEYYYRNRAGNERMTFEEFHVENFPKIADCCINEYEVTHAWQGNAEELEFKRINFFSYVACSYYPILYDLADYGLLKYYKTCKDIFARLIIEEMRNPFHYVHSETEYNVLPEIQYPFYGTFHSYDSYNGIVLDPALIELQSHLWDGGQPSVVRKSTKTFDEDYSHILCCSLEWSLNNEFDLLDTLIMCNEEVLIIRSGNKLAVFGDVIAKSIGFKYEGFDRYYDDEYIKDFFSNLTGEYYLEQFLLKGV